MRYKAFAYKLSAILLSLSMIASLFALSLNPVMAASNRQYVPVTYLNGNVTYNKYEYNYNNSYLTETSKGLMRLEYISTDEKIIVEYYDTSGKVKESKEIEMELNYFGGFYAGSNAYYIVFGTSNTSEDDTKTVVKVVKYSQSWEKELECNISNINTVYPFKAGTVRMTETSGKLYIHTCHEMYQSSDGLNHQANMTFVIQESDMTLMDSWSGVMNLSYGYVSHSFNQFIQSDGRYIYRVDHGDGHPRGIAFTKTSVSSKIYNPSIYKSIEPITNGDTGDNYTGITIGGFELSDDYGLVAYNQDITYGSGPRNVYITSVKLNGNYDTNKIAITSYSSDSSVTCDKVKLVKISSDKFLVMWEEYNPDDYTTKKYNVRYDESSGGYYYSSVKDYNNVTTKMVLLNGSGEKTSDVISTNMYLSDCQPILLKDGTVGWYVTDITNSILYSVDPDNLSEVSIQPLEEIKLSQTNLTIGVDDSEQIKAEKSPWNVSNKPITWTSSNETVATVDSDGNVKGIKAGTAVITASCENISSKVNVTVENRIGDCPWEINDHVLTIGREGKTYHFSNIDDIKNKSISWGWSGQSSNITKVVIKGKVVAGNTLSRMFYWFDSLEKIEGLDNIDTSNVEDLSYIFYYCKSLTSLDLSAWNTSKVTDLTAAFADCLNMTSLDVGGWNTSNVTNLTSTFEACWKLSSLDVNNWNTANVKTCKYTFYHCTALSSLDLSGWDLTNVAGNGYTNGMLDSYSLKRIKLGNKTIFTENSGEDKTLYSLNDWQLEGTTNVYTADEMGAQNPQKDHPGWYINPVEVDGISLSPRKITLAVNETADITCEISPSDTTYPKDVTYKSNNEQVATVDSKGKVTAKSSGTATITAKCNGKTATADITVTETETADIPSSVSIAYDVKEHVPYTSGNVSSLIDAISGDTNKRKAGSYHVTFSLKNDTSTKYYTWSDGTTGSKTVTWEITQRDIANASADAIGNQAYTGSEIRPDVTLKDLNQTLKEGTDYTVAYSSNKDPGTAIVTITGKGNYQGTKTITFTIVEETSKSQDSSSENSQKTDTNKSDTATTSNAEQASSNPTLSGTSSTSANTQSSNASIETKTASQVKSNSETASNSSEGNSNTATSSSDSTSLSKSVVTQVTDTNVSSTDLTKSVSNITSQLTNTANDEAPSGSKFGSLKLKASKIKNTSIRISWSQVKGATGYIVFGAKCGSKYSKLVSTKNKSYIQKKLKKGTYYKYLVYAYKTVNGVQYITDCSETIHVATTGKKVGNYKSVKITSKKKVTIKKGKTSKIKAIAVASSNKLKVKKHRVLKFESSNKKIATVNSTGKIKGKKKGKCIIYVYAQNGVYAKITVTVK